MPLDPAVFRPDAIDDESRQLIERPRAIAAGTPPMQTLQPADVRAARAQSDTGAGGQPIVRSENAVIRTIPSASGEIELRWFIPSRIDGAYLFIHGGGWVLGSADNNDPRLESLSNELNLAVLSVEYRLAPEFPYPAGPDDCETVALWLAQNSQAEFGTDKLLIGGYSAGACLAVAALLRLRDRHGVTPYRGADLCWGVYDVSQTPSSRRWGDEALILSTPIMKWYGDHYAPPGIQREPDVSPLYADLHDMLKALFTVGTHDALLDDSMFMHARWLAAGNESDIEVYPGGVHGLTGYPTSLGRQAIARENAFLEAALKD